MIKNIFDTHAHYDDEGFEADAYELLDTMFFNGSVSHIMNCAVDYDSAEKGLKLAERYENFYCAIGIHGLNVTDEYSSELDKIVPLYSDNKVKAIGEIGLDYYYTKESKSIQKECFERQLSLSRELNLPVIVHDREAHKNVMCFIKKYLPSGVVHCFSGSAEMAIELVKIGFYIGVGGTITFKNSKKIADVVNEISIENILLETDSPYLSPEPFRGKRNRSDYIEYIAEAIGEIKKIPVQKVVDVCSENAKILFKI